MGWKCILLLLLQKVHANEIIGKFLHHKELRIRGYFARINLYQPIFSLGGEKKKSLVNDTECIIQMTLSINLARDYSYNSW